MVDGREREKNKQLRKDMIDCELVAEGWTETETDKVKQQTYEILQRGRKKKR